MRKDSDVSRPAGQRAQPRQGSRDPHRDNDDMRDQLEGGDRNATKPDTRTEARGDAREEIGNTRRGTDADPTGPEGNDRTRGKSPPLY